MLASSGRYTHVDGKAHRRVPFGAYKIGHIASGEDHKFLTNDVAHDPLVHDHQWARELGLVSFAGYQLRIPGAEALGVLSLFAKHPILPAEDALLERIENDRLAQGGALRARIIPTDRNMRARSLYRDHGYVEEADGWWRKTGA